MAASRPKMTAAWATETILDSVAFDEALDVPVTTHSVGENTCTITFAQGRKTKTFKVTVEELTEGGSNE